MRLLVVLGVLMVAASASATVDFFTETVRVASWGSGSDAPIVIESVSYSPEAGGQDTRHSWAIEQPPGVLQATIGSPYSKQPTVKMAAKATLTRESIDKLTSRLAALAKQRPAPSLAARWKLLAGEEGLVELKAQRCPKEIRVKIGAKRVMLWSGTAEYDLGASTVKTPCDDVKWKTTDEHGVEMPLRCYPRPAGYLVRVRLHHGCEGDTYRDRVHAVVAP